LTLDSINYNWLLKWIYCWQYEVVLFYKFSDAYVYNLNWSVPLFWWLCSFMNSILYFYFIYFIKSLYDYVLYERYFDLSIICDLFYILGLSLLDLLKRNKWMNDHST
jgi:hypothetical protein